MLAEIFMLRLEASARPAQNAVSANTRFVPFNLAAPFEFKNTSSSRRS